MKLPLNTSLSLTLALALYIALTTATCYNLDGTEARADVPCRTGVSNCCNKGDVCLTNGLCLLQKDRANALSRGSCTDKNWGPACYAPCSSTNRKSGFPVINMGYAGNDSKYCCGSVTITNGVLGCQIGDPFQIEKGAVIPGVAALTNTSRNCTVPSSSPTPSANITCPTPSSNEVAIGAGVGVPLGVIALVSIAWALWERRRRLQHVPPAPVNQVGMGQPNVYPVYQRPVELATAGSQALELDGNRGVK